MNKTALGKYGEDLAGAYLTKLGYKIIERNFRIRGGEIDIIATDVNTLVYVEVKTRSTHQFGLPEESVNYYKLKFMERASKFYRLQRKNLPELERIDVVSVDLSGSEAKIKLIKNASL
ncbi:MAG: YraN family protein [Patescibacteria group bacterium]